MGERGRDRFDRSRYGTGAERPHRRYDAPRYERAAAREHSGERSAARNSARGNARGGAQPRQNHLVRNIVIAVVAVVLVGAIAAFAYATHISNNLHEGVDQNLRDVLVPTNMANEPFYMVLLGTDGSTERYGDDEFGDVFRTDSMMLARIDPVDKKVTLISIPRDLLVDMGKYGEEKINSAYAFGGASFAVKTVSDLADVPISHFASVDFDGFAAIVDALGGVEVDVPIDIDDSDAGGSLSAGLQTLNGEQALILCRARNAYADIAAHPDEMRTANQRLVLAAIAKKLLASDVATIANTVSAMSQYVTTDLDLNDIIGLAQVMRGLDSESDIYTAAVPTTSQLIGDGWYEILNKPEWQEMMKRVKAGQPPTEEAVIDERTGTVMATAGSGTESTAEKYALVTVKNATDIDGLAASVRKKLLDIGFVNVEIGTVTDGFDYPETVVVYDAAERAREAEQIVKAMGQGTAFLNDGSYVLAGSDFVVVIGSDWK
ncbi:MAG: LCP family protein, partial [Eggerthellaceae bacterium]|nr:LCP family protein [Eggerthellaceae bacterium]